MGLSSSPMPLTTGVVSMGRSRCSSIQDHPGRTPGSSRSTDDARRTPERSALRHPLRGTSSTQSLATRIQSREDSQRPWSANAGKFRQELATRKSRTTRKVSGLENFLFQTLATRREGAVVVDLAQHHDRGLLCVAALSTSHSPLMAHRRSLF